jgi:heavy metal translocating P-type ATPase
MRAYLIAVVLIFAALAGGAIARAVGNATLARDIWFAGVVSMGAPLVLRTVRGMFAGRFAADIVASLSIIGAVALRQPLAGLVIVLMQVGGELLERYAEGRASTAVRALEAAAPRKAHRIRGDTTEDVAASTVVVGDVLLLRPGDIVPCDGVVVSGESELDTSSLTGEAAPRRAASGTLVMSGMVNGLGSFTMRVTAPAERSQYASIVELVRTAQASKAPLQRLADRYAVWFTPITLALCAVTVVLTRDWIRVLSILVVATPCPLILATPVAIIGGINRAAKRHIIIRTGGGLERLASVDVVVFDKTGTLTVGQPRVHEVRTAPAFDRRTVLRYAAAVEHHSSHLLARVLVAFALREGIELSRSEGYSESPGLGAAGKVDGHRVCVGARSFVVPHCRAGETVAASLEHGDATLQAYVSVDDELAAVVEFADEVRPEAEHVLSTLPELGATRIAMISGDNDRAVRRLGERLGIEEAHGDLLPSDKSRFVQAARDAGGVVMMIGDGINDAPALSLADVGVALASHGGGISAQAADVIILVDSVAPIAETMTIGRRTIRIARQSILAGLGLSGAAMIVAAFGGLQPLAGALIQELIDVAVILNALRTSFGPNGGEPRDDGRTR